MTRFHVAPCTGMAAQRGQAPARQQRAARNRLVLTLCLSVIGPSVLAHGSAPRPEESSPLEEAAEIEILCDEDDPATWSGVRSFALAPTAENTALAFRVLDEKLADWESHPKGLVGTVLQAIADHRLETGRDYLHRFLHVDPTLDSAQFVIADAASALSDLGGAGALEDLLLAATTAPTKALPTVASSLGVLRDPRAVPTLEQLGHHPESEVRQRAISGLARFCSPTSHDLVLSSASDEDPRVRNSVAWWLASCGAANDATHLARLLGDSDAMVRKNSLKGLLRLQSPLGCLGLDALLKDRSLTVVAAAEEYAPICESR